MCDTFDDVIASEDPLLQEEDDPACAGGMGRKRPDAWAIRWSAATLYILEFTRPNDSRPDWDGATDAYKKARYQPIRDRIRVSLPTWRVEILTFTMGIRGSFNESVWNHNFALLGIYGPDVGKLMHELVSLCLDELADIYKARQASLLDRQQQS
jgi:hypothetical protein